MKPYFLIQKDCVSTRRSNASLFGPQLEAEELSLFLHSPIYDVYVIDLALHLTAMGSGVTSRRVQGVGAPLLKLLLIFGAQPP